MSISFSWSYFLAFVGGMLVLYWFVFVVAVWIKGYLNEVRIDRWFSKKLGIWGFFVGAFAGAVTPFCSCTTVPIFAGMVDSDIRHGYAISFLIASPTLNPPAILLFYALFGGKMTVIYVVICFLIAVLGGMILSSRKLKKYLIEIFFVESTLDHFRFRDANKQYVRFLRTLGPIVLVAAVIATFLRGWLPPEELLSFMKHNRGITIPGAVGMGGAIYADIGLLIPIGKLFIAKGLDMGLVFAFMMAASGVGLPSVILLTRVFEKELLGLYIGTIFLLFTGAGFVVSWMT